MKKVVLSVKIDKELKEKIEDMSNEKSLSLSKYVQAVLVNAVEPNDEESIHSTSVKKTLLIQDAMHYESLLLLRSILEHVYSLHKKSNESVEDSLISAFSKAKKAIETREKFDKYL